MPLSQLSWRWKTLIVFLCLFIGVTLGKVWLGNGAVEGQARRGAGFHAAAGTFPNTRVVSVHGRTTNADKDVPTDVWNRANVTDDQAIYIPPTQARVHLVVSTDAADDGDPPGTGLRIVRVRGLTDWDTPERTEFITLDGTTPTLTSALVVINQLQAVDWGTAGPNIGTITATAQSDGTISAQINPGIGRTQMAFFALPSTHIAFLTSYYMNMNRSLGPEFAVDVALLVNIIPEKQLLGYFVGGTEGLSSNGSTHIAHQFYPYISISGPMVLKVQVEAEGGDNVDVSAGFDLLVVEK